MNDDIDTASSLAAMVYPKVFRTDCSQPGFALINLEPEFGSQRQRHLMIGLKHALARLDHEHRGRNLVYQSLGRFDQQVTTKPHRDGGPDESILMLGYEPTVVPSRVSMSDYSQCSFDMGLTPSGLLDRHNPMFRDGRERLVDYTTELIDFDHTCFQILIINNSLASVGDQRLQGVLHTAEIIAPDPDQLRVVNSTMIGCGEEPMSGVSENDVVSFLSDDVIRKAAYEK
jgi:hypothetical protein